jgi:sugar lactone lactonase YvrE
LDPTTLDSIQNEVVNARITTSMICSPDGSSLYVTSAIGYNVYGWTTDPLKYVAQSSQVGTNLVGLAISPDGTRLMLGGLTGSNSVLSILDVATLSLISVLTPPNMTSVGGVAYSPDGSRVYVADWNGETVSAFEVTTDPNQPLQFVSQSPGLGVRPYGLAVTLDGTYILVTTYADEGSSRNLLLMLDPETLRPVGQSVPLSSTPFDMAISPDNASALITFEGNDMVVMAPSGFSGGTGG